MPRPPNGPGSGASWPGWGGSASLSRPTTAVRATAWPSRRWCSRSWAGCAPPARCWPPWWRPPPSTAGGAIPASPAGWPAGRSSAGSPPSRAWRSAVPMVGCGDRWRRCGAAPSRSGSCCPSSTAGRGAGAWSTGPIWTCASCRASTPPAGWPRSASKTWRWRPTAGWPSPAPTMVRPGADRTRCGWPRCWPGPRRWAWPTGASPPRPTTPRCGCSSAGPSGSSRR